MKPSETIKCARDLLSDPNKWTKGELARNADDKPVGETQSDACKWCVEGALRWCDRGPSFYANWSKVQAALGTNKIHEKNDAEWMDHAKLLEWLDSGIANAKRVETDELIVNALTS